MVDTFNPYFKPGHLEVFCGPMNCGKTGKIFEVIDKLDHMQKYPYLLTKSEVDTRDKGLKTRYGNFERECHRISHSEEIFNFIQKKHRVVVIDEAQFFDKKIIRVLEELMKRKMYVLVGGLDLNFSGIPFGPMPEIMAIANEVHKLTSICRYEKEGIICGSPATRTQRMINGKPANYGTNEVFIGDINEGYFPRCLDHHFVPGKPKIENL